MKTLGQRPRRAITRISIAVSFVLLLAIVAFPPLAHHAFLHGAGIAVSSAVSIAGGLLYLRSTRGPR